MHFDRAMIHARRRVRSNPLVERIQCTVRRETNVSFPEIELVVPCGPGDVIIDAGANVGSITSRCARTGATVHAFEPNPRCYALLKRRFALMPNVVLYNAGVMDRACSLTLQTIKAHDQYDALDTSLGSSFFSPDAGELDSVEIECLDLASFIESLGSPVALLKMDIEGSEIPVLNHLMDTGAIEAVKLAIVETHERFSPEIAARTKQLRTRIEQAGLSQRIRLDWV